MKREKKKCCLLSLIENFEGCKIERCYGSLYRDFSGGFRTNHACDREPPHGYDVDYPSLI